MSKKKRPSKKEADALPNARGSRQFYAELDAEAREAAVAYTVVGLKILFGEVAAQSDNTSSP